MRVGIEVGGTFTDLVAIKDGALSVVKVPSTSRTPDVGAFNALVAGGIEPAEVTDLVHGSTVATNAILERRGARIAFVATSGFRDILFHQRHDRRRIYDLRYSKPVPPVQRRDCFEVSERIDSGGQILLPLDEKDVCENLIPALAEGNYQAVAICLLSAYASPAHELRLRAILEDAMPNLQIACSHQVAPEFREFERASTTALSAYVQPVIDSYLDRFEETLSAAGFKGRFSIMQSNGGRIPAMAMRRNSITALFSGPAAGVVGATRQALRSGRGDLITFDMGGTSTDVSLVQNGTPALAPETEVDGLPVRTPVLDIVTLGAGGGSLVWVDDGGMLRVGPQSAGAEPGPACYGKGGTLPTITDAHVIRGTIRAEGFLGGTMKLDAEAARRAFADIAARFKMSVNEAAAAAIRLAVANIVRAIQLVSTERGRDPRTYALVPFGGAGPLLAAEIASELNVREILVPPNPGVISALGLLSADYVRVYSATRRTKLDSRVPSVLREERDRFLQIAKDEYRRHGLTGELHCTLEADMRYVGQAFEIAVPIDLQGLADLTQERLAQQFTDEHRRVYLHGGEPGREIELVGLRFGARQKLEELPVAQERVVSVSTPSHTTITGTDGSEARARIVPASNIAVGEHIAGPAMIEGYSSTIWIPGGWSAELDANNNTWLRKQ
jgi:N-methylhydantoinase A